MHDLYNQAPCAYHSLDRDGAYVQINDTELAWLGYTREEVVGWRKFVDFLTPDSKSSRETYPVAKKSGWVKDLEYDLVRKDGSVFPVLLSATTITDPAGEFLMTRSTMFDITECRQAEVARSRLIEILEATPDFVGIADYHGILQYLNRAGRAMVGIGADEDISRSKVLDLHPEETGKLIMETGVPTVVRDGVWQAAGLALRHRDGREIPVSRVMLPHQDHADRVQFFSTVARDISDMQEAQASILRHTAMVTGINRIFKEALVSRTEEELGQTCLTVAEELTASPFGFIDKVDDTGNFEALALRYPGRAQGGRPRRRFFAPWLYQHHGSLAPAGAGGGALARECAFLSSQWPPPRATRPYRRFGGAADLRGAGHWPFGPRQQGGGLQPGGPGSHGESGPGHGRGPHAPPGRRSPEGLGKANCATWPRSARSSLPRKTRESAWPRSCTTSWAMRSWPKLHLSAVEKKDHRRSRRT